MSKPDKQTAGRPRRRSYNMDDLDKLKRQVEIKLILANAPPETRLTRAQTADYLGCSVSSLERWQALGVRPKAYRDGFFLFHLLGDLREEEAQAIAASQAA